MTEREAFERWALEGTSPGVSVRWDDSKPWYSDPRWLSWRQGLLREWSAWQAAAARYEGVVEAARNHRNAMKAFHDSAQAKDTHAQVLAAQLIEQYEGDLYQALAALDGAK